MDQSILFGTDYFRVRHGDAFTIGELSPSTDGTVWPNTVDGGPSDLDGSAGLEIGTAVQRSTVDPVNYSAVAGANMVGFLSKAITVNGPSISDLLLPKVRLPAKIGQPVTILALVKGSTIEVEGELNKAYNAASSGLIVTTGTGAITANTSVPQNLSLQGGRWRLAQTGDIICGILRGQLPVESPTGSVRILIELGAGPASA